MSSVDLAALLNTAPVLSTPETHMLNETSPVTKLSQGKLSDKQLEIRYEVDRTLAEIKTQRWTRVALQFPDEMLPDSARVYQRLARGLGPSKPRPCKPEEAERFGDDALIDEAVAMATEEQKPVRLTILADTSYGSCCVDEVAAEHVDADAVIHYGRACLSPTARLPVLHIFTKRDLDYKSVIKAFSELFKDHATKIILTADVTYFNHIEPVHALLVEAGYTKIFPATIIHDPSSLIPNRTIPDSIEAYPSELQNYSLFHISDPPTSLLLTLSSRVRSVHIYPTADNTSTGPPSTATSTPAPLLRRRYALVTSLTTVSTWGILINTLSVRNYLTIVSHVQRQIANAGKKSYLIVVGKLNAAKVANFSEVGGWVSIGCWESSLIDSKEFYRPVVTPFELELALMRDSERLWDGRWSGDWQALLDGEKDRGEEVGDGESGEDGQEAERRDGDYDSEEESAPPEFDLRTGRYVSQSRPVAVSKRSQLQGRFTQSNALTERAKGGPIAVNGVASPAADFLHSKRTWQGLGSDFEVRYEEDDQGGNLQGGRSGIARGYTVGESEKT